MYQNNEPVNLTSIKIITQFIHNPINYIYVNYNRMKKNGNDALSEQQIVILLVCSPHRLSVLYATRSLVNEAQD